MPQQLWLIGGLVVFIGGVFDMFDGTLARATGQASPLGAFMDSVFDRAGEVIVYIGIVAGLQAVGVADGTLLAAAALGSAVMVSYTRSKSDGLGFTAGTGMAAVGVMPREIRLVILSLGLVLAGILGATTSSGGARSRPASPPSSWPSGSSPSGPSSPSSSGSSMSDRRPSTNQPPTSPHRPRQPGSNGEQQ